MCERSGAPGGAWGGGGRTALCERVREHRGVCECGRAQRSVCGVCARAEGLPAQPGLRVRALGARGVEVAVPWVLGAEPALSLCSGSGAVRGGGEIAAVCVPAGKRSSLRESDICPLYRSIRAFRMGNCICVHGAGRAG